MIELKDITVDFDGQRALNKLDLHVKKGTLLGVIGPGGSGKSTMCRVIAGLLTPQAGDVHVNGIDMVGADRATLLVQQKRMGVQFQTDALFEHMTVIDNIRYPLERISSLGSADIEDRARLNLSMVGLSGFEERFPKNLSGGQRRRVALARACVAEPEILICDDPTAGLDPVTSRRILDMIAAIRYRTNSTVLVVSSDVVGLFSISTRIAMVWDGRVIEEENTLLFKQSDRQQVTRFLDDARLPFEGWTWD